MRRGPRLALGACGALLLGIMRARTGMLVLALSLLTAVGLGAASPFEAPSSIRPTWGVLMEPLLDEAASSEVPSPSLNFALGAGVALPLASSPKWAFEPSAELYWYYAEYVNGRAVPGEETLSDAFTLGLLVDAPLVYSFPIAGKLSASVGGGLCLDLRFAIDTPPYGNLGKIYAYLWDKARFILPSALARAEYDLTERVGFGLELRALLPVFNLWTPDSPGFFDQAIFIANLALEYRLR
jgi:hypothetical protein